MWDVALCLGVHNPTFTFSVNESFRVFFKKKGECFFCVLLGTKQRARTTTHVIDRSIDRSISLIMSKSCAGMLDEMLKCVEQSKCYSRRREKSNSEEGGDGDDDALEFCVNALMRTTSTTIDDDDDDVDDEKKKKNNKNQMTELGLDECVVKKQVYLKCKRGQMDMRTRMRGNKGY